MKEMRDMLVEELKERQEALGRAKENLKEVNDELKRWALEFLRDISFDYNTLHIIDLSSLEQARDIVIKIVGEQHREITELRREIVQLKEEYNALEEVVHTL